MYMYVCVWSTCMCTCVYMYVQYVQYACLVVCLCDKLLVCVGCQVNSKEGFLTKLGYHRKNWKIRWFSLYRNELKYFNTKEDTVCCQDTLFPALSLLDVHGLLLYVYTCTYTIHLYTSFLNYIFLFWAKYMYIVYVPRILAILGKCAFLWMRCTI